MRPIPDTAERFPHFASQELRYRGCCVEFEEILSLSFLRNSLQASPGEVPRNCRKGISGICISPPLASSMDPRISKVDRPRVRPEALSVTALQHFNEETLEAPQNVIDPQDLSDSFFLFFVRNCLFLFELSCSFLFPVLILAIIILLKRLID